MQHSAEYSALCYQAFNAAQHQLDGYLVNPGNDKRPMAIITDVDETVLDYSFFEAQLIKDKKVYNDSLWKQWTQQASCTSIPGSLEFLRYAKQKSVTIFYVSNRKTTEIPATLKNLVALNFPDSDPTHLLFKENDSSKEARRKLIFQKYNVVMLIGDNLSDFSSAFEGKGNQERKDEAIRIKELWGQKFIILPNPVYGDWEGVLLNKKDSVQIQPSVDVLKGYKTNKR